MSVEKPRIAMLGMHLESNAFAPVTTEKDVAALPLTPPRSAPAPPANRHSSGALRLTST